MSLGAPFPAFNLVSAEAETNTTVLLTFSSPPQPGAPSSSASSYTISPPLEVVAAVNHTSDTVLLYTGVQVEGTVYTVTASQEIQDTLDEFLEGNTATFDGIGVEPPYVVSNLQARTDCIGQAIYLEWTNPTTPSPPAVMTIVRRLKQWPFDLTDAGYDIVYQGDPLTSFEDTGVEMPLTTLSSPAGQGAGFVVVDNPTGFEPGQEVRVETVSGPQTFDIVTISTVTGSRLAFSSTLANAYPGGARVAISTPLQGQTYYYYLVLVSTNAETPDYDITEASQAFALSIDVYNSVQWFQQNTPGINLQLDATPVSEGGGGGFLAKWFDVMGCWLNLLRGNANAVQLLNDPDQAPFNSLTALNEQLGIQPEGFSYDYDIVRRPLTSLVFVYKRKGTCPGLIETVSMFTKWTATCVEFGSAACNGGTSDLTTWDGASQESYGGPSTSITQVVNTDAGVATLTDPAQTWAVHLWQAGTVRGSIGDIACVTDSGSDTLTTTAPPATTTLSANAAMGATTLHVETTFELTANMTVQITEVRSGSGPFNAEIWEILHVSVPGAPGQVTLKGPGLKNAYLAGSLVTIGKSILRAEYLTDTAPSAAGQVLTDPQAYWVDHQWVGYKLLDSANVLHNVVDNTGNNTVTVDGAAPADGQFAIAKNFTVGGTFAERVPDLEYRVGNGTHTGIFEPTLNLPTSGTIYDPYNPLYNGPGLNLAGVFGPSDVGIYILDNVPVLVGQGSSATGSIFNLDPNQPVPADGSLVGDWLNPNQNQTQMFEILDNTGTTLTVAAEVNSLIVPGQYYIVLSERDKNRYQRLTQRLTTEFSDTDADVHVLFV
jgi:hypothetical protein